MEKITFENYPSTNTPISADNLNLLQTNVENGIIGLINIVSITAFEGNIKIGNIGIEWGTLDVTPASGSGTNYYGSARVDFANTYAYSPCFMACAGVGSTAINNVSTLNPSRTYGNVWISSTNNQARACRYIVIGVLEEESE